MSKNDLRAKHTPGPWFSEKPDGRSDCAVYALTPINRNRFYIGRVYGPGALARNVSNEAIANARLIAAAPELLEAVKMLLCDLREALDRLEDEGIDTGDWTINMDEARSAIAKAEGNDA